MPRVLLPCCPAALLPLAIYLHTQLGSWSGISFVDSTALQVCHNARSHQHHVFRVGARRGKTAVGWFYGFQLHRARQRPRRAPRLLPDARQGDDNGDDNGDDRRPVPRLIRRLFAKLFGDRGYISQALAEQLLVEQGLGPRLHYQPAQEPA